MLKNKALELARNLSHRARAEGREYLFETEGLILLEALGFELPRRLFIRADAPGLAPAALDEFPGDRVVLKLVQHDIQHKTELGAVRILPREHESVASALADFKDLFPAAAGFLLTEFIPHEPAFGHEHLLGFRDTPDFGPVLSLGSGGTAAEFLAAELRPGHAVAILPAGPLDDEAIAAALEGKASACALLESHRGKPPLFERVRFNELISSFAAFARAVAPELLSEFEINPLVLAGDRLVALDILARVGTGAPETPAPRPLEYMKALYEPRSIAVIGVSSKMNPGHIILRNIVEAGFPSEQVTVVKPKTESIEGCRCVADIASLPEPVDLLIVAVAAEQVPDVLRATIACRAAKSLIVIPGGMAEREGGEAIESEIAQIIREVRATDWRGPVLNGGNCLGIRSRPGHYDTLFIPKWKLPPVEGELAPLAMISQSGAFAIARQSWLENLRPRYLVTFGNQLDLTLADHLEYLAEDEDVRVFACYVEGFKPGDGARFCAVARRIRERGGRVILYRAGRSKSGARAAASHTASVAGDFVVTRELCRQAGVLVAESLEDYDDLVRVATAFARRRPTGRRLGLVSNAGFECVAMADSLGPFEMPEFEWSTADWLGEIFARARLGSIVDIHNPLDLTPIMDDDLFAESVRAVLFDENIDLGVIGCVPLSGALATLPPGEGHDEDMQDPAALGPRLVAMRGSIAKPFVAVVDSGPAYDPFARLLEAGGIPTFRRADRALRILARLL